MTAWSCVLKLQQYRKVMITKHVADSIPATVAPTTIATRVLCTDCCLCFRVDVSLSAGAVSSFCCPQSNSRFTGIGSHRGVPSNVDSLKPGRHLQSEMCLLPTDELACHGHSAHAVAPRLDAYWAGGQSEHEAAPAPAAYDPGSHSMQDLLSWWYQVPLTHVAGHNSKAAHIPAAWLVKETGKPIRISTRKSAGDFRKIGIHPKGMVPNSLWTELVTSTSSKVGNSRKRSSCNDENAFRSKPMCVSPVIPLKTLLDAARKYKPEREGLWRGPKLSPTHSPHP